LDANYLRTPAIRQAFARASLRASLQFFELFTSAPQPQIIPPSPPRILSAWSDPTTNSVRVSWLPPADAGNSTDPVQYRVYRSRDGRSFDGGRVTTDALTMRFDCVTTGTHYFR